MFMNLKSKIGDATDLKKLASPQALASVGGSRQRSSQHTPGTLTPRSRHSRQASTASLQTLGSTIGSPPLSPTQHDGTTDGHDRLQVEELEREIGKLRTALESQQDAALQRLNAREHDWKTRLQDEQDKLSILTGDLAASVEREKQLQQTIDTLNAAKHQSADHLKQTQVLEGRVCEVQENFDQLEGLNAQEIAKIKHMLLNTNSELEQSQARLKETTAALTSAESRLAWASSLEQRVAALSDEKTELETQVAGLSKKLDVANARYKSLEESKKEETEHLEYRISTLEQRYSHTALQESDKVQVLMKEREAMEHCLEEARQQLNNIKASWSDKITALENQIRHLNAKIAEDQSDLQEAEGRTEALMSELSTLKAQNLSLVAEKAEMEEKLASEASLLKEDLETVRWQLNNTVVEKDTHIDTLRQQLSAEEVKHQSCAGVLQCKLENIATLEQRLMEMEEEAVVVKDNLTTAQAELVSAQNEKKSLQETLQQLRTTLETLERGKLEIKSKLDTVSSEKATLSRNLDEYVDKVGALERRVRTLENEAETNTTMLSETEAELTRVKLECEALRTQLRSSEDDLASKIEASEIVSGLKERVKNLEDELAEKKQALKVQGQRVADMKKTIQRELRLTADTAADIVADHRTDARPRDASPVTNGLATNTSADNGLNVNHTYLKHVIIKYLTSREYEAVHLTRAVATLLNMTTEEERLLRETLEWKMSWFGSKPNLGKGQTAKTIPPSQ